MKKIAIFLPLAKDSVDTDFFESFNQAKTYLAAKADKLPFKFATLDYYCHTFPIDANRNECAEKLLEGIVLDDQTIFKPDISIWLDTDHKLPHDTLFRMIQHDKPIIIGVYYMKSKDRSKPFYPVLFKKNDDNGLYKSVMEFPEKELFEVDFAGMGCACIHREVFEKLDRPFFKYMVHDSESTAPGSLWKHTHGIADVTEDRWFWEQVKEKTNYPILVDPQIDIGHIGKHIFDKYMYKAWWQTYKQMMIENDPKNQQWIDQMAKGIPYVKVKL